MKTTTILLVVLLAIGAIQGLIYGLMLCRTSTIHKTAHRFLAAILFFFSYRLIVEILHFFGLGGNESWAYYVLLDFDWVYGPLIYLFVLSYLTPNFKFGRAHWIHFIPVFIEVIWSFYIRSQNFYWDGTRESLSWLGYWGYAAWMHHPIRYFISGGLVILYAFKSLKLLNSPPVTSGFVLIPQRVKWIRWVVLVLLVFSICFIVFVLVEYLFFDYAFNFFGYPIFIGLAIITYWLGLAGFAKRNEVAFKKVEVLSEEDTRQLESIVEKIRSKMVEEQLFKNPELTVSDLSEAIDVKSYLVTKAIAQIMDTKFTDYVNELRFQEVKSLLASPEHEKYTLLSLAFEAGFNSKASFNRTVKKLTGQSPKHLKDG